MPTPKAPINMAFTSPWLGLGLHRSPQRNVQGWLTRESLMDSYREHLVLGPWRMKMYRQRELGIYVLTSEREGREDWHSEYESLTEARLRFIMRYNDICVHLACEVLGVPA